MASAYAQVPAADTLEVVLDDLRVEAARGAGVDSAPFSIAVDVRGDTERATEAGAGLDVALRASPGVFVAGRENPSLGERVVVRGLGYRAGFGVRGVQIVLDGIPLTLADGQAVLGIVDPGFVRRVEIVRGPASALWGNGSGGVLFLQTIPEATTSFATVRVVGGGDGYARVGGDAATRLGAHHMGIAVSHARSDGYRAYSGFEQTRARVFSDLRLGTNTSLRLVAGLEVSPRLEHPGSLTAAQLAEDRRQAELRYVESRSGKSTTQAQLAATLSAAVGGGEFTATAYGVGRRLDNPLPFAYIDVDRRAGGTRLAFEREDGVLRWTLGADAAVQRDDRTNSPNIAGEPGTSRSLDQLETVTQLAAFARLRLDLSRFAAGLAVEGTLRGDRIRFDAEDRLLADGDQSGGRTLGAWSPQLGVSYRTKGGLLYASYATAFETPTTTELVNRPEGGGGFNPGLEPQRTTGLEVGARGVLGPVLYDLAVYTLGVRDGLVPFEGEDGRTYYANQSRTEHRGLEASAEWHREDVALAFTYTWNRLRFGAGEVDETVEGNILPGVPEHRIVGRLRLQQGGFFVAPEAVAMSGVFADDANAVQTDAALVVDLAVGHTGFRSGLAEITPFARVSNVFDAEYVGSVVINARGGRFFEPAAGRGLQIGVEVRF